MEKIVEIKNLIKHYSLGKKNVGDERKEVVLRAVDDVTFNIFKGETLGVVGESGCGKSTLGRCILRLIETTDGKVLFKGDEIQEHSLKQMKPLRKDMQMVFQNPYSSFNPKKTIGKNLRDVAKFYGYVGNKMEEHILGLLNEVNLDKSVLVRRSDELSGGQLQRLAIVRALIPNPSFIMADEPVSALDVSVQAQILNLLAELKVKHELTMMFISHELTVVDHICDRVMVMYLGSMVEIGVTDEIFDNTMHPYTKALIASKPKDHPDEKRERIALEGEIPDATAIPKGCAFSTRCPEAIFGKCNCEKPPLYRVADRHWVSCHLAKDAAEEYERTVENG